MRTFEDDQWDFAPAISLIHSFSNSPQHDGFIQPPQTGHFDESMDCEVLEREQGLANSLGDFDTIWKYLGLPCISSSEDETAKTVRWRDEIDGADLADGDDERGKDETLAGLTKQQRKKVRRRAREKAITDALINGDQDEPSNSDVESGKEDDIYLPAGLTKKQRKRARRRARLAAFQEAIANGETSWSRYNKGKSGADKIDQPQDSRKIHTQEASKSTRYPAVTDALSNGMNKLHTVDNTTPSKHCANNGLADLAKVDREVAEKQAQHEAIVHRLRNGKVFATDIHQAKMDNAKQATTTDRRAIVHEYLGRPVPQVNGAKASVPLAQPSKAAAEMLAKSSNAQSIYSSAADSAYSIAAARKAKLMRMLNERFTEERTYLSNVNIFHKAENPVADAIDGLHIFIDASNIMIGFHDALKTLWKMPRTARIQRQPFSFHSLSLILCRGRPTMKRVIVGSDSFSEMDEAKLIGYETSILDRVHKAKEITPRRKNCRNGNGTHSAGSGSETAAIVQKTPEKWVEQGVDELLHLKMMESVVDAREPATMVLGTGDAAEAEYSGGFLKMIERAMGKGWNVELVCWKQNMSFAYRRKEFTQAWGKQFRVVELDDFVELLYGA